MPITQHIKALCILLISSLLYSAPNFASPKVIGDFGLIDHAGDFHQLSKYRHKKAVVIISQANNCQTNLNSLMKYHLLKSEYNRDDIAVLMMNSSGTDTPEAIALEATAYDMGFPILIDSSQLIAESLGIEQAGEILIINPRSRHLIYQGPPDRKPRSVARDTFTPLEGSTRVADHLNALLSDQAINIDKTEKIAVDGCEIAFTAKTVHQKDTPDYAQHIAPIIEKNCAMCHRNGGIAPFAFDSYIMVKGWSAMMRETLLTKRMPPMQVDPNIRHFENARYLDDKELQTLIHWFDAGAPKGNFSQDPLAQLTWQNDEWELGEPDLIIETPKTDIPASGVLDYVELNLALNLEKDVWVKSIQFIPGNRENLHHLVTQVVPKGYDRVRDGFNVKNTQFLEGYAPGKEAATTFPEGMGVKIGKDQELFMSVHYTTSGKATSDVTRIGLYFYDEPPQFGLYTKSVKHPLSEIIIPAGSHEHKMYNSYVFNQEVVIHALRPHMHTRGKHMKFTAVLPDKSVIPLLSVPNYNFNWQPTYRLSEPVTLPAGSRVVVTGAFDNSENQVGNSDPSSDAVGGLQTWDEMFIGYITYSFTDENNLASH